MFACKRTSQKGFSLVELMVVVAIIGVLASIAIPQVNKFIAKSRQSEAKTNLSSYYTAQKSFQAEYAVYDGRFGAIGYTPEGQMRYNVGLAAVGYTATLAANGFGSTVTFAQTNTAAYCPASGGACTIVNGVGNTAPGAVAGALTAATFTAQARSFIFVETTADVWSINNNKAVVHVTNGIP